MGKKKSVDAKPKTSTVRISDSDRLSIAKESAEMNITSAQYVANAIELYNYLLDRLGSHRAVVEFAGTAKRKV